MAKHRRKNYLVFISHSSKDTWVAKQIAAEVTKCGAVSFLDKEDINIGEDFHQEILDSLSKADELIVLLTPWAFKRFWI